MSLNFWSFVYRATGWYSPWARLAEYKYLRNYLGSKQFAEDLEGSDFSLKFTLELTTSLWQAENGFVTVCYFPGQSRLKYLKTYWSNLWRVPH